MNRIIRHYWSVSCSLSHCCVLSCYGRRGHVAVM